MRTNLYSFLTLIVLCSFIGCSKHTYTADIDTSNYRIGKWHKTDGEIDKMIEPYKEQLDSKMDEVIATNPSEMRKGRPSSTLGNWFSDALLIEGKKLYGEDVDMAFQNYGGIRVPSLGAGDVTVGNIYELMPFDNTLVHLEMSGKLTKKLLDRIAEKGGWPVSSSLSFKIKNNKAVDIIINGEAFDLSKTYTAVLPDYIANGGDNCFFLSKAKRRDNEKMIRDLIISHLRSNAEKTLVVDNTKRITSGK